MPLFKIGNMGIGIAPGGGVGSLLAIDLSAPPAPTVTPALTVGYVDASGARHWTEVEDGVTSISGVAPFFVDFCGYGSVSEQSDSDTADEGWWNLGFLIDYGEGLGGNWSNSGLPKDTDRGFPMFAHAYTTAGTHTVTLTCRDSAGNQASISFDVVVSAPGAGTNMTSGVLPSFTDNTVYNAPAGGTWPNITNQLNGRRNIIIRKTGEGADPVFGTVTLDGRNEPNSVITRTAGVRFLNCDVASVTWGNVGFDYCAFVNGRVRQVNIPDMYYAAGQVFAQSMTSTQAGNVRMARGLMLQDTGVLGGSSAPGYNLIGEMRGLHLKNVDSEKNTAAQHNMRGIFAFSSFRHCLLNNTESSVSYFKFQGWNCTQGVSLPDNKGTPDAWPDSDMVVNYGAGRVLGLPSTRVAVVDCQMGASGGVTPSANVGFGPENNDASPGQGCELSGYEYCNWFQTSNWYTIDLSGRALGRRDCKLNLGAGSDVNVAAGTNHPNRTPDGWNGPFYTSGTRPVVEA